MPKELPMIDLDLDEEDSEDDSYVEYNLTSYPTDFTLSVLYDQWKAGDIVVPDFQRAYVWNVEQASKLIESFLIGLPIPQVFVYVDDDQKLLVIDGQQRITSIAYFFDGYFGEEHNGTKKVFRLTGLRKNSPFNGLTFDDLDASAQRKLKGAPLRAINIRQLKPEADYSSVFQIFERLNTGGTPLKPQEIRNAVYRGPFNEALKRLNVHAEWRKLLGKDATDKHMRDVELLLRVFSLTYFRPQYDGKMKRALNAAMAENRDGRSAEAHSFLTEFPDAVTFLANNLPPDPFRRRGPINSAMLEAVITACLSDYPAIRDVEKLADNFRALLEDEDFQKSISQSTNSVDRTQLRFERAREYLFRQ